jgi:hypothetical protein
MVGQYLYKDYHLDAGDIVHVAIDTQANVIVLDESNYQNYRSGRSFKHLGGFYKTSPINIVVPSTGHWYVVIDLGGGSATIRYSINIIKR